MRQSFFFILCITFFICNDDLLAQAPTCGANVPFFLVDLTGNPGGSWTSPVHSRMGQCCNASPSDGCTSFEILLDSNAAMVSFEIVSGALPTGAMYYQIGCGPQVAVGQPICVTGPNPHYLTFCKPGNNTNTYRVTSIPKPVFPKDDTSRIGCSLPLHILGLTESSITWHSIYPGPSGAYNNYLSCVSNCDSVIYTPAINAPPYIDFVMCGTPIATQCGYLSACDTVRIYNFPSLSPSVAPNPATFCTNGPGVLLNGNATGGSAPYSFIWRNQSSQIVGTSSSYNASVGGNYQLEVRDILYDSLYCPSSFINVPVTAVSQPIVNAGPDQTVCSENPAIILNGNIQNAPGGTWTGGAGTFSPSNTSMFAAYTPTNSEIASGSVTLTLTSTGAGGGCTNSSDNVTIHFTPPIVITIPNINAGCNGNSATLSPTVTGGTSPYSYQWSSGATGLYLNTTAGVYCLTVTDSRGCSANHCGTITEPSALTIITSSTPCSVNNGNDGTATASVSGGTSSYTYLWSNGGTSSTIAGLSYGIYTVVVTDDNGCEISSSVVVNEPRCNNYYATSNTTNIECFGLQTGSATAYPVNGTPGYSYLWNDPLSQTTAVANNISAGVYQCVITDGNNCSAIANATVTQPPMLSGSMGHSNVTAIGGNDGAAQIFVNGGTPAYNYAWSNGGTASSINSLTAGSYSITVRDANNCSIVDSVLITQPPCNNLSLSVSVSSVSCFGGNNGSASAIVLFGTNPLSYLWSTGATSSSISGLSAGNYNLTITDGLNCNSFINFNITQPSPLSAGTASSNVTCSQTADGTIELNVIGGTYPYNYSWSNGSQAQDLINLTNGTYSVLITDARGCTTTASATITRPAPIVATSTISTITCYGGNNGAIDLSVSGGAAPYTYSWSNGQTTQDISGLSSGNYSVTVTDANHCVMNVPLNISMNEPGIVQIDSILVECPFPGSGHSNVIVYAGGGNGSYQISFDNGNTFLGNGVDNALLPVDSTYMVIVTDTFGCTMAVADSLIIQPAVDIQMVSFVPCIADGQTTINVTANITGGNGDVMLSFDNGNSFLPPGIFSTQLATGTTYTVVAQDSSACLSVWENITIPSEIILSGTLSSYAGGSQVSCFGSSDGFIDLTPSGGMGNYSYSWSTSATTEDVSNLSAGSYSVVVTDSAGCSDTIAFTISQPQMLTANAVATSDYNGYNISCAGGNNGIADLSVSGGTPGYSYSWNNGATSEDLSGIAAGNYVVVILDSNGCTQSATVTLNEPPALTINSSQQNVPCNGFFTGSIDITIDGGVQPINYSWSNGAFTEDLNNIGYGFYSVNATDANGCPIDTALQITESSPVTVTDAISNPNCFGELSGSIDLSVYGGTYPYSYHWSNGQTTQDVGNLDAGIYVVTVLDSNNCVAHDTLSIVSPDQLASSISSPLQIDGHNISMFGGNDGSIILNPTGGTAPYHFLWNNGSTTQNLSGLTAGTYSVIITDANGCVTTQLITLDEPFDLEMPTGYSPNNDGYNDAFVVHGIEAYPDNHIQIFNRWGNLVYDVDDYKNTWQGTGKTGGPLPDGTYFVILTINTTHEVLKGFVDLRR